MTCRSPAALRLSTQSVCLLAIFGALACILAIGAASAVAAPKRVVGVFGAGDFGTNSPRGIAVNETTGDVYVADGGGHRVLRYSAAGALIGQLGSGSSSNAKGNFNTPQGVAVDQSDGSLWVVDGGNVRVQKFDGLDAFGTHPFNLALGWDVTSPATSPAAFEVCTAADTCKNGVSGSGNGQFSGTGTSFTGHPAFDPVTGGLYVPDPNSRRVQRFDAATGAFEAKAGDSSTFGASSPTRVAVDSTGALYFVDYGNNRVQKCFLYGSPEVAGCVPFATAQLTGKFAYAIAVDRDDNHVYVATRPDDPEEINYQFEELQIVEVEADGDHVDTHLVGTGITTLTTPTNLRNYGGLAVDSATDTVYLSVSDQRNSLRRIVAIADRPAAMTVDPVLTHGADTATFTGTVNPNGAQTTFRFEHSIDGGANWTPVAPDVHSGNGTTDVPVTVDATGLEPASATQVRLVAIRELNPDVPSAAQTFTTDPAPPAVTGADSFQVTDATARLLGQVDPNRQDTTYQFQYGTSTAYGSSIPVPAGSAGAGARKVPVAHKIEGLQPGTTYHYTLVATNDTGTAESADQTFTTGAGPAPAGRVYEQVSPVEKGGADIGTGPTSEFNVHDGGVVRVLGTASEDGEAAMFSAVTAFADPLGAAIKSWYVARRDPKLGWLTENVSVPQDHDGSADQMNWLLPLASTDLTAMVGVQRHAGVPALTPDAQTIHGNAYVRHVVEDAWELVTTSGPTAPTYAEWMEIAGGSDDLSHVVFNSSFDLTPAVAGSPPAGKPNLYEYADGAVRLVSILPDGTAAPQGGLLGSSDVAGWGPQSAVSADGARIVFESGGQLYLREASASPPKTTWISQPAPGAPEPAGPSAFQGASDDGSAIFFSSSRKLTPDSTANAGGGELYRYDVDSGTLSDISVAPGDPNGASVAGVLGFADDGSRVYFVGSGIVVPGEGTAGQPNLYLWEDDGTGNGSVSFIATLAPLGGAPELSDASNWRPAGYGFYSRSARVSPDGRYLLFLSKAGLTGYPTAGFRQAYLFDAEAGGGVADLACASCNELSGGPSTSSVRLRAHPGMPSDLLLEQSANVSADGDAFFDSDEGLVPEDRNGKLDVYVYRDGEARLVTTGRSTQESFFVDATPDGDDAFFLTSEALVPSDVDDLRDMYVARTGGGIPLPPVPTAPCSGDECQGDAALPPPAPAPASTSLTGPRNLRPGARLSLSVRRPGARALKRAARSGRLRLAVRTNRPARITAQATAPIGGKARHVGRAVKRIGSGGRAVVTLRLARDARRALARGRRLPVRVVIRAGSAADTVRMRLKRAGR